MPIAVMCPSCSANFSVKDELAGRRAKCPKCGEPLTIPGGAPTPTPAVAVPAPVAKPVARPVAARPVAAPVKPTDDDDDRPKGKKRRDDEEADARPTGKKRRDDDEADEDRPKGRRGKSDDEQDDKTKGKRRRRDDDDEKPKKKSALPLVLGILGGVLLLCGGGCAGGWFFWLHPNLQDAAKRMKERNDALEAEINKATAKDNQTSNPFVSPNAIEVLALDLTAEYSKDAQAAAAKYQGKKLRVTGKVRNLTDGAVLLVGKSNGRDNPNVVAFYPDAKKTLTYKPGDWVSAEGVCGGWYPGGGGSVLQISDCQVKSVPAPANLPPDEPTSPPTPSDPSGPVVTTDDAMIQAFIKDITSPDRMYKGKQVKMTGKVADVNGPVLSFGGKEDSNYTYWVLVNMAGTTSVKKGDTVTVVGKYQQYATSLTYGTRTISLTDGKVEGAVGTPAPTGPTITPAQLVQDFEKYKGQVVTVRGKIYLTIEELDRTKGTAMFDKIDGAKMNVRALMDKGNWRSGFLAGEDTIEVRGKVTGPLGNKDLGFYIELQDTELLKRTTKDGKDVPIPAKVVPSTRPADSEAIEVTATALLDEFLKDAKEAEAKYKGKLLKVTGNTTSISPGTIRFAGKTEKAVDAKKKTVEFDCHVTATIEDGGKIFEDAKGKTAVIGVFKKYEVNDFGAKKSKVVFLEQCKQVK